MLKTFNIKYRETESKNLKTNKKNVSVNIITMWITRYYDDDFNWIAITATKAYEYKSKNDIGFSSAIFIYSFQGFQYYYIFMRLHE